MFCSVLMYCFCIGSSDLIETLEAKAVRRPSLPAVHVVPKRQNDLNEREEN